jgi:hypothetical protein
MSRIFSNKKYLLATAEQLEQGIQFSPKQMEFWSIILRRIAEGEPAEVVLNLKRKKGERLVDDEKRKKISLVLHLIASRYKPFLDPRLSIDEQSRMMTLEEAIFQVLPEVPKIMGDGFKYEFDQIRDWWYDKDKTHMQSPLRDRFSPDDPFS